MDARSSSSSSPDPLEYPGDPKFLLSSATKSIPRRPSLSPRKSQSPLRRSQSPTKDVNNALRPLKFSDVVLPSTPSGKDRDRDRGRGRNSVSPSKATMQSEGNVSPWRIRVTVEAAREDEEEGEGAVDEFQGDMRAGAGATTTKVPLKSSGGGGSSAEPTPKKRKTPGRPKSAQQTVKASPGNTPKRRPGRPRKSLQSTTTDPNEGNTPKAPESPAKASPGNTPKRGPGRPRKSLQFIDPNGDTPKAPLPEPPGTPVPQNEDPFLDIAMDNGVSEGTPADELDTTTAFDDHPEDTAMPDNSDAFLGATPKQAPQERGNDQENELASPISQRQDGSSPENTLHAGHTPRPSSRLYPTPTPSSHVDEDAAENRNHISPPGGRGRVVPLSTTRRLKDPTTDHREFDSIVEGEGFSMVSLDTLPSAKQELSGAAQAGLNAASGVLSASQGSQDQTRMDEPPATTADSSPQAAARSDPDRSSHPSFRFTGDVPHSAMQPAEASSIASSEVQADDAPPSPQQPPPAVLPNPRRRPLSRLARVVRTGIALRGVLNSRHENSFPSHHRHPDDETEAVKQPLDHLFGDFDIETRRALNAGLLFGNELAMRRETRVAEQQGENRMTSPDDIVNDGSAVSSDLGSPPKITSPSNAPREHTPTPTPKHDSTIILEERMKEEMSRRQAEWQRERDAISREIEAANSSRVIVIDDTEDNLHTADAADRDEEMVDADKENIWPRQDEVQHEYEGQDDGSQDDGGQDDEGQGEMEEDGGYADDAYEEEEDIWQQEAQQVGEASPEEASSPHQPRMQPRWEIQEYVVDGAQQTRGGEFSMLTAGKTQMARYRDGDFEFSSFLGTPESATRRFYQDDVDVDVNVDAPNGPVPPAPPPHDGLQSARSRRFPTSSPNEEGSDQEVPSSPPMYRREAAAGDFPPPPERSPPHQTPDDVDDEIHVDDEYLHIGDEAANGNYNNSPVTYHGDSSESDRSSVVDRQDDEIGEIAAEGQRQTVPPPPPPAEIHTQFKPNLVQSAQRLPQASQTQRAEIAQSSSAPPSSWFTKLADFAPSWLSSKITEGLESLHTETTTVGESGLTRAHTNSGLRRQYVHHSTQASLPSPSNPNPKSTTRRQKSPFHKPLALGGYWTDDHYEALSRLYDKARKHPERFPYEPTPERDEMLGRWVSTPDGRYPRQITEFYLAIAARFGEDLVEASRQRGGSDKLEFTELGFARHLWAIIIGRKIRRERKLANRVGNS